MAFPERDFWISWNYVGANLNARSTSAVKYKTDGEGIFTDA